MDRRNASTRNWNNISDSSLTRDKQFDTFNKTLSNQKSGSFMWNMTKTAMKFIDGECFVGASCMCFIIWTWWIDPVKSPLDFYFPNDLPFFIVDLANVSDKNSYQTGMCDSTDGHQHHSHWWGKQYVLQKDTRVGLVSVGYVDIHIPFSSCFESSLISCYDRYWFNFGEVNKPMTKPRHVVSRAWVVQVNFRAFVLADPARSSALKLL